MNREGARIPDHRRAGRYSRTWRRSLVPTLALLVAPEWRAASGPALSGAAALSTPMSRQYYLAAAAGTPDIADWLLRRAALATPDSAGRAAIYGQISLPIVRARIPETEALARERNGDFRGAAIRYDSLNRVVDATRVRLFAATANDERLRLRRSLVEYLAHDPGGPEAQAAIELLFFSKLKLPPDQALLVARAAARERLAQRAVSLFPRAIVTGLATAEDRLAYGLALAQLGRQREALAVLAKVPRASSAASEARYQRAVSWFRLGEDDSALAVLKPLARSSDSIAPRALYLAGDIRWRSADGMSARQSWLELVRRYPGDGAAGRAAFLAALVLWENGRVQEAATEWEQIQGLRGGADGLAAGYWAGRSLDQLGDSATARSRWQAVIARDSLSYYALASARRLGVPPWAPPAAPDRFQEYADLDSTATRLEQLRTLDMTDEQGWERDRLLTDPTASAERLLAEAAVLRRSGAPSAAIALARRALRAGAPADARTYRLLYPLLHEDDIRQQARLNGLDPEMVAALIRQESTWEAKASSRTGALGLMQLMPATGRQLARGLGIPRWNPDLLFDPATNIRLGTRYLADVLRRFEGDLDRALAAYNAGPNRVGTWATGEAATDPDLFVERISLVETRNYVRIVQRNLALYRALYGR